MACCLLPCKRMHLKFERLLVLTAPQFHNTHWRCLPTTWLFHGGTRKFAHQSSSGHGIVEFSSDHVSSTRSLFEVAVNVSHWYLQFMACELVSRVSAGLDNRSPCMALSTLRHDKCLAYTGHQHSHRVCYICLPCSQFHALI